MKNVGDGAGETRWGQTPAWLATFGFSSPNSAADAAQNYRTWLVRTGLIHLCDYPDDLADSTIDFAVNSGHRTAIRELQRALGAKPDGVLGPETQAAIESCDRPRIARRMLGGRLRFLGRLITDQPERQSRWAAGWMNRLANQIEVLV